MHRDDDPCLWGQHCLCTEQWASARRWWHVGLAGKCMGTTSICMGTVGICAGTTHFCMGTACVCMGQLVSAWGQLVSTQGRLVSAQGRLVRAWGSPGVHRDGHCLSGTAGVCLGTAAVGTGTASTCMGTAWDTDGVGIVAMQGVAVARAGQDCREALLLPRGNAR